MNCSRFIVLAVCLYAVAACAQTAEVGGAVQDPSGAVVPKASVKFRNHDTGFVYAEKTNNEGQYRIVGLEPGKYDAAVEAKSFKTLTRENVVLQVGDKAQIDFRMQIGNADETVTVDGSGQAINTTDAATGTVIDRNFVEQIPLNGRSFQALIALSPGVISDTPQGNDHSGEFSVNGQRTASNDFSVDGASAMNNSSSATSSEGTTGSSSNATALGTTQSIISIDALQEFRIATSTYSAEFGGRPGAQVSFTSRSGTNQYHGTAFDYLRNYAFDANDWFDDYSTPPIPTPQEHQNDFGGVLGGPLSIPKLLSGRDRAFFFFSYEGLRLDRPSAASISYVPSNGTYNTSNAYADPRYKNLRANAPVALQPVLNGFPLPNCSTARNPECVDYGDGLSPFIISTALPSTIDSISARVDFQPWSWLRMFARYSDTESSILSLYYNNSMQFQGLRNRAYLLGADSVFRGFMTNQLRLQYSIASNKSMTTDQSVGGSQPVGGPDGPNLNTMQGLPPIGGKTAFEMPFGSESSPHLFDLTYGARQFQPNVIDTLSWTRGSHLFKVGINYRQTVAYLGYPGLSYGPLLYYFVENAEQVLENSLYEVESSNLLRQDPVTKNLGVFVQDEWRFRPRISFSFGLRWDLNPPPTISGAQQYTYTGSIDNPSSLALSRLGAPMYKTTYTDFGPRLGVAITVHDQPGHETVLRAGGGIFYDTGQSAFVGTVADGVSLGATNFQEFGTIVGKPQTFPLSASVIMEPVNTTPPPPYTLDYVHAPNFVPPYTTQWSAALEQAFGAKQSLTITHVGTAGRKLSIFKEYSLSSLNPLFKSITEYENGPDSIYTSLQVHYMRQMMNGLQAMASYTWAHAIDSASADYSSNGILPPQRGNSDHDVRDSFSAALLYDLPSKYENRWDDAIFGHWSTDITIVARTAFPVEPLGSTVLDPLSGNEYPARLNYNGAYPYLHEAGIPGGRQFNPAVFSVASSGEVGTAPRNFLRGFGEKAVDMAIQRQFPIYEQSMLQFRAEAFNIFNHPNFGYIDVLCGATAAGATCNNPIFGEATSTLSNSLGGLTSMYQQGGPRSMQFALKLQF